MFLNGQPAAEPSKRFSAVPKTPLKEEGLKQIDLPIRGMSCASCAEKIETGLPKLEGVKEVSVNFAAEKGKVLYDPFS